MDHCQKIVRVENRAYEYKQKSQPRSLVEARLVPEI